MTHNLLLQNLETAMEDLGAIPLWGSPPPFPLEDFAKALSESFEIDPFNLQLLKTDFYEHPLEGMGETPFIRPFVLSPLPGEFFLVMAKTTLPKAAVALLSKDGKSRGFSDETLLTGFLEVALLNAFQTFNQLNPFGNLSIAFADDVSLPSEGSICTDLTITIGSMPLSARIIAPRQSLSGFRSYFEMDKLPFTIDQTNSELPLSLSYVVGSTTLSASEWKSANQGDCLLLDRCTINLSENKGTALLSAGTASLFDVRIKGDEAKILDYAMTQKDNMMTDENPDFTQDELTDELPHEPEAKPLPADQIPLTVKVELGRFQMPLEKVSQLKPGNVLDLKKSTDAHVHLTIGGKCVAKGELVALGDALGVKILKLGD